MGIEQATRRCLTLRPAVGIEQAARGHRPGCPQAPHPLQPAMGTEQAARRHLTLRPATGTEQAGPRTDDYSPRQSLVSQGVELALLMDG